MRPGRDVDDPRVAVRAESVITPAWLPVKDRAWCAEVVDRHRQQGGVDPLAGGEQHVQLARRRDRATPACARSMQLVGRVAHRGDDDDDVVAGLLGVDDPLATRLMLSASATDEPPYFCTTRPMMSECNGRVCAPAPSARQDTRRNGSRALPVRRYPGRRRGPTVAVRTITSWGGRMHGGIAATGCAGPSGTSSPLDGTETSTRRPGDVEPPCGAQRSRQARPWLLVRATLLVPDAGTVRVAGDDPVTEPRAVRAASGGRRRLRHLGDADLQGGAVDVAEAFRPPRARAAGRIDEPPGWSTSTSSRSPADPGALARGRSSASAWPVRSSTTRRAAAR